MYGKIKLRKDEIIGCIQVLKNQKVYKLETKGLF